jgi:hypothetical protein
MFKIKCLIKLNRDMTPFRVTLGPSRENATSKRKRLALLGVLQLATQENTAKYASQDIHKAR